MHISFIGVINIFLFFILPLLILFLTRKKPIRQMILWTASVQAVALFIKIVLSPIAWRLSWGTSFSEAVSFSTLSSWYSGSGVQMLHFAVASIVFTALAILCTAIYRQKKEQR